jgi:hypothetical protein
VRAARNLGLWAAAFLAMSFSYQLGANPPIDYPRLLISDTQSLNHVFEDEEIIAAANIVAGVWQSSMQYSGVSGQPVLPTTPVNYLRTAAILCDAMAANKSRLSSVVQLLDVKLSPDKAADALRKQAQQYREIDDDSMAFVVIEQCHNEWTFRDRFWKQVQRTAFAS